MEEQNETIAEEIESAQDRYRPKDEEDSCPTGPLCMEGLQEILLEIRY